MLLIQSLTLPPGHAANAGLSLDCLGGGHPPPRTEWWWRLLGVLGMSEVRTATLKALRGLCSGTADLPELDAAVIEVRAVGEVRGRCLALYVAVAVAFGLDRVVAMRWLTANDLRHSVTDDEEAFITCSVGEPQAFRGLIESLWALAWVLGVVPRIDWRTLCSNDFIRSFPDPRSGGLASPIGSAATTVSAVQLTQQLDIAYVLHHSHVEAALSGGPSPSSVSFDAVAARRRALEWAESSSTWDEVEMDT